MTMAKKKHRRFLPHAVFMVPFQLTVCDRCHFKERCDETCRHHKRWRPSRTKRFRVEGSPTVPREVAQMENAQRIAWEGNVDAAFARAKDERRFVFLDVFNPG
jgi:hypothetical protein